MQNAEKTGVIEKVKKFAKDGYGNLITGLNTAASKKKHTRAVPGALISDGELEAMYVEDGLAARIVNLMPSDMFREGWKYVFPGMEEKQAEELAEKYKAAMEVIEIRQKCKEAMQWARLKGGAALLVGAMDGRTPDQPLDPKRIKTGGLEKLRVLDRSEIEFDKIRFQTDPMRPRYGLPECYAVKFHAGVDREDTMIVHHSRIIEFHGDRVPRAKSSLSPETKYWGISVLQRAEDRLKTIGSSIGSIDQLLHEMSVGKFKVKDLAMMLSSPDGKAAIERRVELMDLTRSVFRSQYIDATEEFSRDSVNFSGVPDVLHIIFMLLAADTGYPITRLFGVSPAGMNATGESDMRNYYDAVRSEQELVLQPVLMRLVKIVSQWQNIEEPYIEFVPLETMNEKEQADLERNKAQKKLIEAQTWKIYIDTGMIEPHQAAYLQFGDELKKIPDPGEDEPPPVDSAPEPNTSEDEA